VVGSGLIATTRALWMSFRETWWIGWLGLESRMEFQEWVRKGKIDIAFLRRDWREHRRILRI
jgi:hypothetical protein